MKILMDLLQPVLKGHVSNKAYTAYFDGSTSAVDQGITPISNFTNTYDGDTGTSGIAQDVTMSANALYTGTNVPVIGKPIKKVEFYCRTSSALFGPSSFGINLTHIGSGLNWSTSSPMAGYTEITAPAGGWTWEILQDLVCGVNASGDDSGNPVFPRYSNLTLYGIFIRVSV